MEVQALHAAVKDIQLAINGVAKGVDLAGGKLAGSIDEMVRRTHRSTIAAHETFEDPRKQAQSINIPEDLLTSRVDALVKRSSADLEGLSAALANAVRIIQLRVQALTTILSEIPGRADAEAALADSERTHARRRQIAGTRRSGAAGCRHEHLRILERGRPRRPRKCRD